MPYNIFVSPNNAVNVPHHDNELEVESNTLSYDQLSVHPHAINIGRDNILEQYQGCINYHNEILKEITKYTDENRPEDIKKDEYINSSLNKIKESFEDLFNHVHQLREEMFGATPNPFEYKESITSQRRDEYIMALVSLSQVVDEFTNEIKSMKHNVALDIDEHIIGHLNGKGPVYQDLRQLREGKAVPLLPSMDDDSDLECG